MPQTRLKKRALNLSTGGRPWWIKGSNLHAEFAPNRVYGASSIAAAFSLTRASAGLADDANGDFRNFAAGAFRQTSKGLRVEEARTNSLRNNSAQGVSPGTPGSVPTNWNTFLPSGVSREVVVSSTVNGVECTGLRFFGTPTATGNILVQFEGNTQIASAAGVWTISTFARLRAGSMTNVGSPRIIAQEYTSGNSFVGSTSLGSMALGSALARFADAFTAVGAGGNIIRPFVQFGVTNGQPIDFTIDIGLPQVEFGSGATSPIRTTSSAVLRASDFILLNNPNAIVGLTSGWIFIEWQELLGTTNLFRRLWRYRKDGNNAMEMNLGSDGRLSFGCTVGGVAQISGLLSGGLTVADGTYKAAFRWGAGDFAARFSPSLGAQPANFVGGSIPDFTGATFGICNVGTDGSQANDNLLKFASGIGYKSDAELLDMVA